jgi:hypothetical protein
MTMTVTHQTRDPCAGVHRRQGPLLCLPGHRSGLPGVDGSC